MLLLGNFLDSIIIVRCWVRLGWVYNIIFLRDGTLILICKSILKEVVALYCFHNV